MGTALPFKGHFKLWDLGSGVFFFSDDVLRQVRMDFAASNMETFK